MKALTERELTCLGWAALGKTSWEMGVILGVTERTVNFHIHNACKKLSVHSRQAAITAVIQAGMMPMFNDAPHRDPSGNRGLAPRGKRPPARSPSPPPTRAAGAKS